MDSFKKTSLRCYTGRPDRDIWRRLWDPNFQKIAKFPQIRFAIFWLIIFKVWKNYNQFLSKLYLYDLNLVFESLFKKYSKKDSCSSSVFLVFVIVIGSILWGDENEFRKNKRGFFPKHTHSQKPLSILKQMLSFNRFEFIFVAYFSRFETFNNLLF